jgi:cell shape-determining protein MreC
MKQQMDTLIRLSKLLFILILIWAIGSIALLLVLFRDYINNSLQSVIVVIYAICSFILVIFLSSYHLWTLFKKKKRLCDLVPNAERLCNGKALYFKSKEDIQKLL